MIKRVLATVLIVAVFVTASASVIFGGSGTIPPPVDRPVPRSTPIEFPIEDAYESIINNG